MTVAIIDYGVGNLFSLASSLRYLGVEAKVTADAAELRAAERLILPGVGAFGEAKRLIYRGAGAGGSRQAAVGHLSWYATSV